VYTFTVTISCQAGYSFGRILNLTTPITISASATAALGSIGAADCPLPMVIEERVPNSFAFADASGNQVSSIDNASTTYGYRFGGVAYGYDGYGRAVSPQDSSVRGYTFGFGGVTETTPPPAQWPWWPSSMPGGFQLLCLDNQPCGATSTQGQPGIDKWLAQKPCHTLSAGAQVLQTASGVKQGPIIGTAQQGAYGWRGRGYTATSKVATCASPPVFAADGITVISGSACIGAMPIITYSSLQTINGTKSIPVLGFAPFYVQVYDESKSSTTYNATISGQFVKVKYSATLGAFNPNGTPFTQLIR
jgi:hypothetical protein